MCIYIYVHSRKVEHSCRMIYAGSPSFFGLGLDDGHVPSCGFLRAGLFCAYLNKRSLCKDR